jgi:hypothetical protein
MEKCLIKAPAEPSKVQRSNSTTMMSKRPSPAADVERAGENGRKQEMHRLSFIL